MLKNNLYLIVLSIYILVIGLDVIKLIRLIKKPPLNFNIERYFYRIHLVVLFCGVSLTIVITAFEVNIFNYSKPIEYSQREEIGLEDFNGFKLPGQTLQGGSEFAFITTNIEYKKRDSVVTIKSYFHPARSYVYIDNLQSESLLRHELYHFHITEIWAREFRKLISEFQRLPSTSELNKLYEQIFNQENVMQMKYDYDTDHSYLLGQQLEWEIRIDSTLNTLSDFEHTEIQY